MRVIDLSPPLLSKLSLYFVSPWAIPALFLPLRDRADTSTRVGTSGSRGYTGILLPRLSSGSDSGVPAFRCLSTPHQRGSLIFCYPPKPFGPTMYFPEGAASFPWHFRRFSSLTSFPCDGRPFYITVSHDLIRARLRSA